MPWYGIVLVAWFTFCAYATVKGVGKPRPAITPGIAALTVIVVALQIWAVTALAAH